MNWSMHVARAAAVACLALSGVAGALERDGQHDFDFNLGTWHTEITRSPHPLTGSRETYHMSGTVRIRPVWGGRALLEEIDAVGPYGPWQGATMFLYNPKSHQWSQHWFDSASAHFDIPLTGAYVNGNIELYSQDTLNGRAVLVRGVWSDIKPTSHTYTESFSDDGGKTWEVAFVGRLTKEQP